MRGAPAFVLPFVRLHVEAELEGVDDPPPWHVVMVRMMVPRRLHAAQIGQFADLPCVKDGNGLPISLYHYFLVVRAKRKA